MAKDNRRKIKIKAFGYTVEVPDPYSVEGKTRIAEQLARRGDVVELRDIDIARGEADGAFADSLEEDVFAPFRGPEGNVEPLTLPSADAQAENRAAKLAERAAGSDDGGGTEEVNTSELSHKELVEWIQEDTPTVPQTVNAAGGDPEQAKRILKAEKEATGGQPRKSLVEGLNAIVGGDGQDKK